MEICDLAGFEAVVRTGSFSRAAEATFRSQPAVSLQVARLERELGVRLLDRGRDGVRPTREGAAVAALASEILDRVRAVRERRGATGRLVVGAGQEAARAVLPPALRAFRRRRPAVDVAVRTAASRALLDDVAAGRVHLAILTMPLSAPGVALRPFRRYHFVAVGGTVRDPLILPEPGGAMRAHVEGSLVARGIAPRIAMETSSTDLALAMARAGVGAAILPSFAYRGRRVEVPPQTLCLAWRAGTSDAARDELADLLRRR